MKYYFFPIDVTKSSHCLILLNKTQIFGTGKNGDAKMMVNIEPNIQSDTNHFYKGWKYPTVDNYAIISNTGKWDQPEFIQPNSKDLYDKCTANGATGCALVVGVVGTTE